MAGLKWLCCIFTGGINIVHCLFSPVVRSTILKSIVTRLLLALFTIYLLVFELYLVLPSLFDGQKCLVSFILLLIFVCFYVSVVKCISVDPSIRGLLLSSKSRPDWTYCVTCQTLRPPRAHHCFDCATCVLRRDHHCTIIAQCIGHANWRYFCNTIFYGMLGCAFMTYYNMLLIFQSEIFPSTWSLHYRLVCMVAPPGFMWLTGYLTALQSIIFLTTSLTFLTACLLFVFIIYQFNLMLSNQTMFERAFKSFSRQYQYTNSSGVCNKTMRTCLQTKGDTDIKTTTAATVYQQHQPVNNDSSACIYNVGYMNNIKQYLGERWILALLCPLINSPLTTDGLNFPISDGVKFK